MSSPYAAPTPDPEPELQYVAPQSGRPIGVTVFAILNILFGIMGVLGTTASVAMLFLGGMMGSNPVMDMLESSLAYRVFFGIGTFLGLVFSIVLLVSGFGLLKMSRSARKMALAYAIYMIIAGIVTNGVNVFVVFMPMLDQASGQQGPATSIVVGSIVGAVIGGFVGMIFPVSLLIYFMLPSVKQRFETWEAPTN